MKFMENQKELHLLAANRILRYLKCIIDFLFYKKGDMADLIAFCNSDYAEDIDDHKEYIGLCIILSLVSWSSKKCWERQGTNKECLTG